MNKINFKNISFQDRIVWLFCIFFFLLPIFYVPRVGASYILSQKLLVVIFVTSIFGLWLIQLLRKKKEAEIDFKMGPIFISLSIFLLFSALSFLFSKSILQSFLGRANTTDSFFMIVVYLGLAFLASIFLKNREAISKVLKSFSFGSALLALVFLASLIFQFKNDFFAPVESFSIIFSLGLVCLMNLIFNCEEKKSRIKVAIILIAGILLLTSLLIINCKLSWFLLFIASFLIFWQQASENNFVLKNKKIMASLVATLAIMILFFSPKLINHNFQLAYEQILSYDAGIDIAQKTLSESDKNFLIGSGPATFIYEYSLYKGKAMGDSDLVFNQGPIALLTLVGSLGILTIICFLASWIIFLIQGFRFLFLGYEDDESTRKFKCLILPVGVALFAMMFLYKMTIIPMVFSFFVLGIWIGGVNEEKEEKLELKNKEHVLKIVTLGFFLVLIFGLFVFAKQYYAESFYGRGVRNYFNTYDIDYALQNGLKAVSVFEAGDYYIGLSQLSALKASQIFNQEGEDEDKQAEVRNIASEAEAFANLATKHEPQNYNTWNNLGLIYENTSFLVDDKNGEALTAYDQAKKLAPHNFDIYYSEGRIYEAQGENQKAIENYEKALELNPTLIILEEKIKSLKKLIK